MATEARGDVSTFGVERRRCLALALALGGVGASLAGPAMAWQGFDIGEPASRLSRVPSSPAAESATELAAGIDRAARMTAPVLINGRGPFFFVVDTGASRSVISAELADLLGLPPGGPLRLHGTGGVRMTSSVTAAELGVGDRLFRDVTMASLPGADIGGFGILGVDSLAEQRVTLDFRRTKLRIQDAHRRDVDPLAIVVRAKSRFGQLTLVDAHLYGRFVYVILDSGAQNTVGNAALRRFVGLERRANQASQLGVDVLSVTGQSTAGEQAMLPELKVGGLAIRNLPMVFADLHTFAQFDLVDEPAMLLGVDVLRHFDAVSVDFGRKEVRFSLAESA